MAVNYDIPYVKIYPPVLVLVVLTTGVILQFLFPIDFLGFESIRGFGLLIIAVALILLSLAHYSLKDFGTPPDPLESTLDLMTTGLYRYSRNPIYLAFLLIVFGAAIWLNSFWLILFDIVQLIVLTRGVIIPEERYLSRKFGERYVRYSKSVRRWF